MKGVRAEDGRGHQKVGRNEGDLKWKLRRWIGSVRFSGSFWIGIALDVALAILGLIYSWNGYRYECVIPGVSCFTLSMVAALMGLLNTLHASLLVCILISTYPIRPKVHCILSPSP